MDVYTEVYYSTSRVLLQIDHMDHCAWLRHPLLETLLCLSKFPVCAVSSFINGKNSIAYNKIHNI